MNNIETRPIGQVIRNANTPERSIRVEHFLIPSYQRGYRWTELHVKALLEDIDDFLKSQSVPGAIRSSYCLQPIVVVAQQDEEGKLLWEIVDGQQRLTTLSSLGVSFSKPELIFLIVSLFKLYIFVPIMSDTSTNNLSLL